MSKKRERYIITGPLTANGVSLTGTVLIDLGPCGYAGKTKDKDGKSLPKKDLKYRKFRFEDVKSAKTLGINKSLTEWSFSEHQIKSLLTLQNEENT